MTGREEVLELFEFPTRDPLFKGFSWTRAGVYTFRARKVLYVPWRLDVALTRAMKFWVRNTRPTTLIKRTSRYNYLTQTA